MPKEKMTIDQAIAIIRKEYLCVDRDCDIERSCGKCDLVMPSKKPILEAYKMAIKALEQMPTKEEETLLQKWRDNRGISMEEFEDAMNTLDQGPCGNAIDRAEAIKVASGYCHPANVAKELAKLPSVNPQPCEDAISRQAVIDGLASIAKAKAKSDAQKSLMGRVMFFTEHLPSVNPQTCGDAIDRQAALGCCRNEWEEEVEIRLKSLPSVNHTKTGHWINTGLEGEIDGQIVQSFSCSECGAISIFRIGYKNLINSDLCPNCGAKMSEIPTGSESE